MARNGISPVVLSILALVAGCATALILTFGMIQIILYAEPGAFGSEGKQMPPFELQALMLALSFGIAIAGGYVTGFVARRREVAHALALGVIMAIGGFVMAMAGDEARRVYMMILSMLAVPGVTVGGFFRARQVAPRAKATAGRV